MKKTIFLLTFLLGAAFIMPASGQSFLEKMAKKAAEKTEKKAQEKAEKKADEQIDKGLNAAEESLEGKQEPEKKKQAKEADRQKAIADMMSKMGMTGEPVNVEDAYSFKSSITMNIKNYKSNGELNSDGTIILLATPGEQNFAYEFVDGKIQAGAQKQKGIIIMDYKNEATIILNTEKGKKTGIVYGLKGFMDESQWEDEEAMDEATPPDSPFQNPNLKKTGRTKSILGYKCEEYRYEDEFDVTNYWITKDYKWDSKDFMSGVFKSSYYSHGMPWGFMMESESMDKETGEKSIYVVKDIDKNANKNFDLSAYEITNVGSFNMPTE